MKQNFFLLKHLANRSLTGHSPSCTNLQRFSWGTDGGRELGWFTFT